MNEEEIIKNIKEMIQWSDHNTYKIALQGILDLYEQEKERNKELEQIEKEHKEENGRLRDRVKELEKTDLSNSKIIANMSERHFHDREKIRELEAKNKELNIIRLNMLLEQFPDTTETYKKYKKELEELLKTS